MYDNNNYNNFNGTNGGEPPVNNQNDDLDLTNEFTQEDYQQSNNQNYYNNQKQTLLSLLYFSAILPKRE